MRKVAVLLILTFIAAMAGAQNDLKVSLKPDSIRVGELTELQWQFTVPAGTIVLQLPSVPDSMPSGIEVIERKDIVTEKKNGREIYKQLLTVSAYDSGTFVVPALRALLRKNNDTTEILSDSLILYCTTVPVDTTAAVKDVKDIYEVDSRKSFQWLWFVLGGAVLAAAGIFLYFFLRKKRKPSLPDEAIIWINPSEQALASLRKMQESRSWYGISPKDFYTELVEILRKYLIYSRNIKAEEMLSSELLEAVSKEGFPANSIYTLNGILRISDMAKFARFKPEPGQFEKSISDAIAFVIETTPAETKTESHGMDE